MKQISFYHEGQIIKVDLKYTNNKNIYMKITKKHTILITAPRHVPEAKIKEFGNNHIARFVTYIEKAKKHVLYSIQDKFIFVHGKKCEIVSLMGFQRSTVKQIDNKVYFKLREDGDAELERNIKKFLKREALKKLASLQIIWEKKMEVPSHEVRVSYKTTTWGTNYTSDRRIFYSARLAHHSDKVKEYVVIHELAHSRFAHHQSDFWNEVEKYMPDYKVYRKQLRADQEVKENG